MAIIIDGKATAQKIKQELMENTKKLKANGVTPSLVVILVGDDPASQIYVHSKAKVATEIGIAVKDLHLPATTTQAELLALIEQFNQDPTVDGILVQLPLPDQIDETQITTAISPLKDVDGFHPLNVGRLLLGDSYALPCTPAGIIELLKAYQIDLTGQHAVVVGRSNIVGRPMSALLLNNDATVTITHSRTKNLSEITKTADILIVAAGQVHLIKASDVKPGAVVIDVGINRLANKKLVGDVDFADVVEKVAAITPVPGGVGPMTIMMLMKQTIDFAQKRQQAQQKAGDQQ